MRKVLSLPLVFAVAATVAACPGDDTQPATQDTATTAAPAPGTQQQVEPAATPAAPANLPPGVTAQMVSQGQQLYGTVCVACHGANGTGGPLGPALNDQNWIHITGEFEELVNIINVGVAQPREYPGMMPARGGGNFTEDQIRSIAAYVYSISHGG